MMKIMNADVTVYVYEVKHTTALPHWSCNPVWELGNYAHALALAADNRAEHPILLIGTIGRSIDAGFKLPLTN
jgi:hypothetical protein